MFQLAPFLPELIFETGDGASKKGTFSARVGPKGIGQCSECLKYGGSVAGYEAR